ncbi:MAG: ATP-dependent DNA helicase RecG [Clostridiales bacterium]|jgi:ATP-dependent DNA helicase RecG|nr:ATP-dependent DNA helicase RecG [Clostridiales bacterium]
MWINRENALMHITALDGMTQRQKQALLDAGYDTADKLLRLFPRTVVALNGLKPLENLEDGQMTVVLGRVAETPRPVRIRRGLSVLRVKLIYGDTPMTLVWFNQDFYANSLAADRYYYAYGRLKKTKSSYQLSAPRLISFPQERALYPFYPPVKGVSNSALIGLIEKALAGCGDPGYLRAETAEAYGLIGRNAALRRLHRPETYGDYVLARRSLSAEELGTSLAAHTLVRRQSRRARTVVYADKREALQKAADGLPYRLTGDQRRALDEVICDMSGPEPMNRLLQGDVGSGKTVVAMLAMYYAYLSGCQAVLMAPTEILAFQHYQTALKLFEPLGVRCCRLSGSLPKKARDAALFEIESGAAGFIIGTHALLSEDVIFKNPALIVTDEQQRFGVGQRGLLESKSAGGDILSMSATPIPRTLSLALYGELRQSVLKEKPEGRKPVVTRVVRPGKERDMWDYLKRKAAAGEQSYVVCPRIDEDDDDGERTGVPAAKALFDREKAGFKPGELALIHGRLKEAEKNAVMRRFESGEARVLIATTVVEVGLDVRAATSMVIYGADRLGLSQLHQLRGRVGRGERESYCFILDGGAESAAERLGFFAACSDGFELAEYDFMQRGGGEFVGEDQSGGAGGLILDEAIVRAAKGIAADILSDEAACKRLRAALDEQETAQLKNITLN